MEAAIGLMIVLGLVVWFFVWLFQAFVWYVGACALVAVVVLFGLLIRYSIKDAEKQKADAEVQKKIREEQEAAETRAAEDLRRTMIEWADNRTKPVTTQMPDAAAIINTAASRHLARARQHLPRQQHAYAEAKAKIQRTRDEQRRALERQHEMQLAQQYRSSQSSNLLIGTALGFGIASIFDDD